MSSEREKLQDEVASVLDVLAIFRDRWPADSAEYARIGRGIETVRRLSALPAGEVAQGEANFPEAYVVVGSKGYAYDAPTFSYVHAERDLHEANLLGDFRPYRILTLRAHPAPAASAGALEAVAMLPEVVAERLEGGWRYEYSSASYYVEARHPQGGRQSVLEICTGAYYEEYGHAVAAFLNSAALKGA